MGEGERLLTKFEVELRGDYENLAQNGYTITSERTSEYNCVSFAIGREDENWWPPVAGNLGKQYWPNDNPDLSVSNFVEIFRTLGFEDCDSSALEEQFEKIAIYEKSGRVMHVARQEPDGTWKSKLGTSEDIQHNLAGLEGHYYGRVVLVLRRTRLGAGGA